METKKSQQRFTEEFKVEAVKQVTEKGFAVAEVAVRLGVSAHSLYSWIKRYSVPTLAKTYAATPKFSTAQGAVTDQPAIHSG